MLTYIKSFNIQPPGSSIDNTPDSVDWANISWIRSTGTGAITSKQISGISTSINLYTQEAVTSPDIELYYRVDNSEQTGSITSAPSSPWVQVSESPTGTTFSVNNNQWVSFCCYSTSANKIFATTITITNKSDNDAPLDTFTIEVS